MPKKRKPQPNADLLEEGDCSNAPSPAQVLPGLQRLRVLCSSGETLNGENFSAGKRSKTEGHSGSVQNISDTMSNSSKLHVSLDD